MPPGTYRVRLDAASVPVTYRIEQPEEAKVEVQPKTTHVVSLTIVRSAGVRGTVLFDRNGDGTPDQPTRGVPANISLVDANGVYHATNVSADGSFAFRSLPPGKTVLTLSGLPLGDQPEGGAERTVTVTSGSVTAVPFLIHPVSLHAKTFGGGQLAIRSVDVEAKRVPPASGPLVRVVLSGAADVVTLETSQDSIPLKGSGANWTGRLPVPANAKAGLFTFLVKARRGEHQVQRRGQVLVDSSAPLITARVQGAGAPGAELELEVTVLAHATTVRVDGPAGTAIHGDLIESARGRWSGSIPVSESVAPGHYALTVTGLDGGRVLGTTSVTAVVLQRPADRGQP